VGTLVQEGVPDELLLGAFALLLVAVGVAMLRPVDPETVSAAVERPGASPGRIVAVAVGVGFLTGFLGVGGGFVVVPALVLLLGVAPRAAVGTSLLVLLINAVAGLATRAVRPPDQVDPTVTVLVTIGAAGGAVVGAVVSRRLPSEVLRRSFGFLALSVAVGTTIEAVTRA
jgi:hypothetical protein